MPPLLCWVTDRNGPWATGGGLPDRFHSAVRAGVDWIQVREKDLPARTLVELARAAVGAAHGRATKIIVNDRLDVALAVRAAGVHLGAASLPLAEVARARSSGPVSIPPNFLIGASCHSLEEAREAEHDGASYIFFGPVFSTPSKAAFGPPQGLEKLGEVCRQVRIPVLAIGGINVENAGPCLRAGAGGLAAIRLFQQAADLGELVARLRAA